MNTSLLPQILPFSPPPPRRRLRPSLLVVSAITATALLAGLMSVALAAEPAPQPLTREAVLQDLKAYRESGLQALEADESLQPQQTAAWQQARKRYLAALMQPAAPERLLTRQEVLAELKAYQASGLAALENHEGEPANDSPEYRQALARFEQLTAMDSGTGHALTRAEVLADLAIYRESGLAAAELHDSESGQVSDAQLEARKRYEALKRGGRYQTLVVSLGTQG